MLHHPGFIFAATFVAAGQAEAAARAEALSSTVSPQAWTPEQEAAREIQDQQMFWAAIATFIGVIGVVVGVIALLR
jgi:hypothetical protein